MSDKFGILMELIFQLGICIVLYIMELITLGEFMILLLLILYFCNNQLEHLHLEKEVGARHE